MRKNTRMKKIAAAALSAGILISAFPAAAEVVTEAPAVSTVDTQKLDTYYTLALNAINAEDYDTALQYLNICFVYCKPDTNPELYADLLLKRACIDLIQGDTDIALLELDASLEVQPDLADAYLVRTQIYTALGEFDPAVENLEKYIELTEDTSLYETVALLHEANGDLEQAEAAYDKYAESNDVDPNEAGYQAGYYRMEGGNYEGAIEAFEAYVDDETFGAGALYNIGVCQMSLGDYEKAAEAFTKCEEKEGYFSGLYYNRGVSRLMGGDWENAGADFEKSISTEPFVDDARYNLGICQMQLEKYEAAIVTFTDVIEGTPVVQEPVAEPESAEAESETEAEAETIAEPETEAEAGTLAEPETEGAAESERVVNDGAYYYRAVCYAAVGNLNAALADYTTCIEHGYDLSTSYYERAQIYAALGDAENQSSDLQNSLKYSN